MFALTFREKRRVKETRTYMSMWERSIDHLPPVCAPTKDQTCNVGMSPNQELNLQPFSAWNNAPTNQAMWPGPHILF